MKRQVVLITGVNGFIGSNLARRLVNDGFTVHGIVRNKSNLLRIGDLKQLKVHLSDLSNISLLKNLFKKIKPNYIFHLATYEDYRDESKFNQMVETNIIGTKNLIDASDGVNYKLFVNTGSSSEYGFKNKPMKEDNILNPISNYAVTKACATHLSSLFAIQFNKPIITFRLFSVFGPGEARNRLIPTAVISVLTDKPISLTAGLVRRDFIFIDDVIDAYICAMKANIIPGEIYNIGSSNQFSNEDIVKVLEKISGKKTIISKRNYPKRIWDTDYWVADNSKARKKLKWKPKYNLELGLRATYLHVKDNLNQYV